jgi:hypothetical protein
LNYFLWKGFNGVDLNGWNSDSDPYHTRPPFNNHSIPAGLDGLGIRLMLDFP